MSTTVVFKSYSLGYEMNLEIPDGLPDERALKDFIDNMKFPYEYDAGNGKIEKGSSKFSRRDRKSAFRVARREYKAYDKAWWDKEDEEYENADN